VEPGQPLRVTLVNRGSVPHNLEFELPTGEVELEQNLPPGERRTLELTAPREPGRYVDYRPVGEHRQRGMEGTLLVQGAATR
jgi:plastocyanin